MPFIKRLSSNLLGLLIGIVTYYLFTGKSVDWMLIAFLFGVNLIVMILITLLGNGRLGKKLKTKNK